MRHKIWLALAAVLVVGTVVWTMPSSRLVAEVPFGFYVANEWMEPGEYTVVSTPTHHQLRPTANGETVMFTTFRAGEANAKEKPAFVFTRYTATNRYFLKKIVNPEAGYTNELPMSRLEREAVSSRLLAESVVIHARLR